MTACYLLPDFFFQLILPLLPGLETLVQWAVSASALILLVLGVRFLLRRRLSCRFVYALWAVVLVRLLLPFQLSLPLPVTAAGAAPGVPASWEEKQVPLFPSRPQNIEEVNPNYQTLEPGYSGPGPGSQGYVERSEDGKTVTTYLDAFTPTELLRLTWGLGVLAVLLLILVPNLRFAVRLTKHRRALEVPDCPLPVYEAEGLPSPCLSGLFHPAIYLTPEVWNLPENQRRHILAHELTHFRHKDHLWAVLRCLALALHWYNPLVWLAVIRSKGDGELACDEGTVQRLGEGERLPYGRTLVDLVARRSLRPGDLISCSTAMAGGNKAIKQRIAQLVKQPETKKTALFAAAALAALAAVFTFAGTSTKEEGYYAQFRAQIQSSLSLGYSPTPNASDSYTDPVTDDDLLEEAKAALNPARDLLTPVELDWADGGVQTSTILTLNTEDGSFSYFLCTLPQDEKTYVLTPAQLDAEEYIPVASLDQGVTAALEELARQQEARNRSITQVEYPEFKSVLTDLFLGDEECVAQNDTPEHDMEEWLTRYTSFYEISHCSPWWLEDAPMGWYARAMDAGSWYSISIPDHLVEEVLAVCAEQAAYPSLDTVYSALENADTIYYAPSNTSTLRGKIQDPDVLQQITQLLLTSTGDFARQYDPGRVTLGEEAGVLTIPVNEVWQLSLCLQEGEDGCLLSCVWTDDSWFIDEDTLPVLWVLPAGTSQDIQSIYEDWQGDEVKTDSTTTP